MFQWLQRLFGRRTVPPLPTIATDVTGFTLTIERVSRAYPWASVRKVAAMEQDLHSHDRIVLLIEVQRSDSEVLTVSEDCPGFAGLFGPMEQALGIDPSWYLESMTPAFEATPTVLCLREQDAQTGTD